MGQRMCRRKLERMSDKLERMFGHVCLFGSGGPLACLVMFKQTC